MKILKFKKWIIAVAIIGGAAWYFTQGDSVEGVEYQTQPLTLGDIESLVNAAGSINPVVTVEVGSEISGLVQEINVDFNSTVTAGQVIARIDDRTVLAQVRQEEANMASAQASLSQQQASLVRAQAQFEQAERDLERTRDLYEKRLVSTSEIQDAETLVQTSKAEIEQVKAQVAAAEASILQREAAMEQIKLNLDRTYIRSPVDGVVVDRQIDIGQAVSASLSAPLLFLIAQDLSQMQIEAEFDEANIGKVQEGMDVRFTVEAYPDRNFVGTVAQVRKASTITNNVVTYKVIIDANNPGQVLLPGMTANVNVVLGSKEDVLLVPAAALRFRPAGAISATSTTNNNGRTTLLEQAKAAGIELTDQQEDRLDELQDELTEAFAEARENAANAGGFGRPAANSGLTRVQNELKLLLTAEQYAALGFGQRGERGSRDGEKT